MLVRVPAGASLVADTSYQIFQDGDAYKVKITRLGTFIQEAGRFSSRADAKSWIAQDQRIATIDEQKEPIASAHLRLI